MNFLDFQNILSSNVNMNLDMPEECFDVVFSPNPLVCGLAARFIAFYNVAGGGRGSAWGAQRLSHDVDD